VERALDLLLLDDIPDEALQSDYAELQGWEPPSFPLKGGDLIAMGLPKGPIVAKTLHELTTAWCEAGFPAAEKVRELARSHVDQALRDRQ
jgi:poly(A) polymerase